MENNENLKQAIELLTTDLQNIKNKTIKHKIFIFAIFGLAIVVLIIGLLSQKIIGYILIGIVIPALSFVIIMGMVFRDRYYEEYKEKFKNIFVKELLLSINETFKYSQTSSSMEYYKDIGIQHFDEVIHREDFIEGVYSGVNFKFCETGAWHGGKETISTGLLICEFYKDFKHKIIIQPKDYPNTHEKSEKFDNEKFNKNFQIILENSNEAKIEARYIITNSFMEKLSELQNPAQGKYVNAVFENGKFYLFLENVKNLFEPNYDEAPTLKLAEHYKNEFLKILSVIDELNLTLKIYPKTVFKK